MRGALFVFAIRNVKRDVSWCFDIIKEKTDQNKQKKKKQTLKRNNKQQWHISFYYHFNKITMLKRVSRSYLSSSHRWISPHADTRKDLAWCRGDKPRSSRFTQQNYIIYKHTMCRQRSQETYGCINCTLIITNACGQSKETASQVFFHGAWNVLDIAVFCDLQIIAQQIGKYKT